jgi:hypothetical protein
MGQLLLHLWGDFILQSDWMAQNKTKSSLAAAIHAICYSLPFWILQPHVAAWAVILVTHFFIDRFRLARFVVSTKNMIGQPYMRHLYNLEFYLTPTGYPAEMPAWMAVWLLIIADNVLHLTIKYLALRFL